MTGPEARRLACQCVKAAREDYFCAEIKDAKEVLNYKQQVIKNSLIKKAEKETE
jgi:excinuclease UvrABC nuclease subunit